MGAINEVFIAHCKFTKEFLYLLHEIYIHFLAPLLTFRIFQHLVLAHE